MTPLKSFVSRTSGQWIRTVAVLLVLVWLAVIIAGCASHKPPPRPTPTAALAPQPGGALAAVEEQLAKDHGPQRSGFMLLERNEDALLWRLALIDSARHTLDLQYYVWFGDRVGQLLMARVLAAADRGVKVRILFDDLNSMLHDMTHVELRDEALAMIDRHPNIEIRLFNGWQGRGLVERVIEGTTRFTQLNRRMHNKQMIADNRLAIIGGRNIGDEYFGLNDAFNFHDLDVLGAGPVAREASTVFDRYWNADFVRNPPPLQSKTAASGIKAAALEMSDAGRKALMEVKADRRGGRLLSGERSWDAELQALPARLLPGTGRVAADPAARDERTRNRMPQAIHQLMMSAKQEVLITNAYIIPDEGFIEDLKTLTARGVKIRILTNSLSSHDVPAVNSHYEAWRIPLLKLGIELHELRSDAAIQGSLVDTAPVRGEFVGLHVKAMVVDRQRAFVGSMNLDPRSEVFNSEMGVVIDSPELAAQLARNMARDMSGANSWRVRLDERQRLKWHSDAGTLERQPARDFMQRLENLFFKAFPQSLY